ncbi:ADP-ribosylation factor-like protein 16 isoform X1 [Pseudopipra pipra]|uniref:ADP-ribosylation factor-like protein 16 isoform X1 n=1 Tax=Pseudopipra pipra TaxID=415032 RepID=UPI00313A28B5
MVSSRRRPGPTAPARSVPAPPRPFRFRLPPGRGRFRRGGAAMAAGRPPPTVLLLGAAGGGKSLLVRRLRQLSAEEPAGLGEPPATLPTVGRARRGRGAAGGGGHGRTQPSACPAGGHQPDRPAAAAEGDGAGAGRLHGPHLAQLLQRVQRSSGERHRHPFVVDASNPTQVSSSCIQLLSVLSAAPLASVPVLVLFNKIDLPCYMSLLEMKSLFRMQDIVSCATQPITMLETSARDGTGLADVLQWLRATLGNPH